MQSPESKKGNEIRYCHPYTYAGPMPMPLAFCDMYDGSQSSQISQASRFMEEQNSLFNNILSVSDLERDELYCRRNWSLMPAEATNFTNIENSKIVPPDFMPIEDSLFKNLNQQNDTLDLRSLACALPPVVPPSSSGKELIAASSRYTLDNDNSCNGMGIPSIASISLALQKDDSSAGDFMDEILNSDMELMAKHTKYSLDNSCSDNEISVPSIANISLALRQGDINASTSCLVEEILKSGANKPSTHSTKDAKVFGMHDLALEDHVCFGSTELHMPKKKSIHLINHCHPKEIEFLCELRGHKGYRIIDNSISLRETRVKCTDEIHEIFVEFNPCVLGPAVAELGIYSASGKKIVPLNGFGGKSNLILLNISIQMHGAESHILLDDSLCAKIQLKNAGSAPAFFSFHFGILALYLYSPNYRGIVTHLKEKTIQFGVLKDNKFALTKLLNYFDAEKIAKIGKITLAYGEESTRQRIKRLSKLCEGSGLSNILAETEPQLLMDYSEIPFNLEELSDVQETVPFLMNEDINQVEISILLKKDALVSALTKLKKETVCKA